MGFQSSEQLAHDRINLIQLVRRLEKAVGSEGWNQEVPKPERVAWIKTQGTLQKIKFAHRLLKNVELHADYNSASTSRNQLGEIRTTLDKLEAQVSDVGKRISPIPKRPSPILPTLPLPSPPRPSVNIVLPSIDSITTDHLPAPLSAQDLLLSPSDTVSMSLAEVTDSTDSLLPQIPPPSNTSTTAKPQPAFLQNSQALQEELSEQLAQMASQLKRNAIHFAGSLERDKSVVIEAQEKLEKNYDVMSTQRVRLRDHSSKSWGTTWITMLSIVVAIVGFMLTFFVIRLT